MRRALLILSLLSALLSATAVVFQVGLTDVAEAQPRRRRSAGPGAGTKQPPAQAANCRSNGDGCPLHDWMEANIPPVIDAGDTARLAALYDQMAGFAPSASWNEGARGWRAISEEGARKARAGDLRGARASCKGCHTEWRARYRTEFRARALPR